MARRERKKAEVSLFPFLSILACVIGTLTLLITGMALSQMDNDAVAEAERLESFLREAKREQAMIERLNEAITQLESSASQQQKELAEARVQLAELERTKAALLDETTPAAPDDIPDIDAEQHEQRVATLKEEIKLQAEEIERLTAEVAKRRVDTEADLVVRPSGSGRGLQPTFIECAKSDIVLLQNDPPKRIATAKLGVDEDYLALLDEVADDQRRIVTFLIRDDGAGTYNTASRIAREHYARNGKLPLIGHGKIDLSLFD